MGRSWIEHRDECGGVAIGDGLERTAAKVGAGALCAPISLSSDGFVEARPPPVSALEAALAARDNRRAELTR